MYSQSELEHLRKVLEAFSPEGRKKTSMTVYVLFAFSILTALAIYLGYEYAVVETGYLLAASCLFGATMMTCILCNIGRHSNELLRPFIDLDGIRKSVEQSHP